MEGYMYRNGEMKGIANLSLSLGNVLNHKR